jgi:hypothetical protein
MTDNVVHVDFSRAESPALRLSDRSERLEQVARASANLLLGGVHGDISDIEANTDYLTDIFSDFDPPITGYEADYIFRKAVIVSKEIHKLQQKKGA